MLRHVQLARGGAWWLGEAPPATPAAGGPEPPDFPTLEKNVPESDSTHTQNERRVAQICPRVCPHAIHEPQIPFGRLEPSVDTFCCRVDLMGGCSLRGVQDIASGWGTWPVWLCAPPSLATRILWLVPNDFKLGSMCCCCLSSCCRRASSSPSRCSRLTAHCDFFVLFL